MNFVLRLGVSETVRDLVDRMAILQPELPYLICAETGRTVSFREFKSHAKSIGVELVQIGASKKDKIAFLTDNSVGAAELLLGVMYAGFVAVPLNVRAGISQLSYMIEHSDAKIIYVHDKYRSLLDEATININRNYQTIPLSGEPFSKCDDDPLFLRRLPPLQPDDPAMLVYSSGTTGQPKGAVHTQKSILAHGRNSILAHELTPEDRSLLVLPIYHINAECVTLIPTLMSGGSVVVTRGFVVSEFWNWLDDYRCTWSALVPTIIAQLLDWKDPKAESRAACFKRIRFLRSSSAPLSPALHCEFLDKFRLPLIQAMGSSEGGNVFSNPVPPGRNKIGSPGLPWGFDVRIVGRGGEDVPAGEPGELLIRGDGMMQGYYKDPAGTAAALDPDRWLHTGDLAYLDEDGYAFVVGRSKELIIKGGMNIAPKQIDEVLESHPSVLEAAAVGVPDRYVGEEVVAFAVLRDKAQCEESELLAFCESRLGHFKTPARILFVSDLPKGPSGKVQRLKLLEKTSNFSDSRAAPAGKDLTRSYETTFDLTQIEDIIGEAWAKLLKHPDVDRLSNFFSLGGDSLLAIQCLAALRDKLPVRLSIAEFFENATVADQATLIRQRLALDGAPATEAAVSPDAPSSNMVSQAAVRESIPLRDRSPPYPLSPNQRRLWFMEQLIGAEPVYNEAEAVRLKGELKADVLEKALAAIVARHDNLRTTFRVIDNEPMSILHNSWPFECTKIDLSALPSAKREEEVERLLIDEPRRPYHLEREPAFRVTLIRLGSAEHVLIVMMHHILCDWASMGNVWRDLSAFYGAECRSEPVALAALPIRHGEYAARQHELLSRRAFAKDLEYWRDKLRGAPALLELPADRARPPVLSYKGARLRFEVPGNLTQALRACGRREKVSLFTVFAAALDALLYRYTGREDIIIGIPLSDRDESEIQNVIGFFLHTHALRTRLSGGLSFRELLFRVQKDVLDLYVHRAPPFDEVVSAVQPTRSSSYSPIFQVMLNWRGGDQLLSRIGLNGLEAQSVLAESRTSKFDLTLMLTDAGDAIDLEIEYSTDLFDAARIERMAGHFNTLLEGIANDPSGRLSDLPLLTEAERHQLIDWNQTVRPYRMDRCVHELFEEQVELTPDAIAVTFEDCQLTYRSLDERANRLARRLRQLGVGPETLVAVCMDRSLEMVAALLGILKAGGAYVPLDPAYPRERLAHMLSDSGAVLLLTEERLRGQFETASLVDRILCIDEDQETIAGDVNETSGSLPSPENLAYVIYTSGSTGAPKGVEIRHRNLVNLLSAMARELSFGQGEKLLALTTISFDIAGLELFLPLICGGQVEVAATSELRDGFALRRRVEQSGATVMQATPATWMMLIDAGWTGDRSLRALCGGEAVTPALAEGLAARSRDAWNVYGPTETTIWSSFDRIRTGYPLTIGRPIANTQFHVVDKQGELSPIGVPGELLIGGDGLARGYFRRPELTAEKFVPNRFRSEPEARVYKTGDLVRRLSDGTIEWLGRLDHQIKIRGFRIELGEIESVLATHPAVREAAALAREDAPGDKRLVAYLTVGKQETPKDSELRAILRAKLPEHMIPSAFVVLDHFPLTPNGKIDRQALPRPAVHQSIVSQSALWLDETQKTLSDIWCRALRIERVGLHDNFFDLGGHSLLAIRVIAEINKTLEIHVDVPKFFQNPTIEALTKNLESEGHVPAKPRVLTMQSGQAGPPLYFIGVSPVENQIAKFIGKDRAVFGTDVPLPVAWRRALKGANRAELPTIEQLGSLHGEAVRAHAGTAQCVLAGYSFHGKVVIEAARAYLRKGGRLATVLLIDATAWRGNRHRMRETFGRIWRSDADGTVEGAAQKGGVYESLQHSVNLLSWTVAQAPPAMKRHLARMAFGDAAIEEENGWVDEEGAPVKLTEMLQLFLRDESSFKPTPIDAAAVLFRTRRPGDDILPTSSLDNGWGGCFTQGLQVIEARGDHWSLVRDVRNVAALAQQINTVLDKL